MSEEIQTETNSDRVVKDTDIIQSAAYHGFLMHEAVAQVVYNREPQPFEQVAQQVFTTAAQIAFHDCLMEKMSFEESCQKFFDANIGEAIGATDLADKKKLLALMYKPIWIFMELTQSLCGKIIDPDQHAQGSA